MAGEFDFEPVSDDDLRVVSSGLAGLTAIGRMARELLASRAALRKVVDASCTIEEKIAAMKTARALVAHVGGERGAS